MENPSGQIVGTAGLRTLRPGLGEIKRMWVRPGCQGLGLGRRLLGRSPEEAQALGFRALRLDTERRVEAALRPYRNCGFTEFYRTAQG